MLLHKSEVEVESEGVQNERMFGFEDSETLYRILRDKMYSNAVSAICREVSCNARDAHREVGKHDLPITIHLPTKFEPFFKVKDQGPGISPERMDIFTKYGASTKRDSNDQTGGFGLGAKTPFAYSDAFNIVTVTDGIKRTYTAQIDETRKGKMFLLNEQPTDESNGTEIILEVEPKDFEEFERWTHHSTKHWKVKPNLQGGSIVYRELRSKAVKSGDSWFLVKDNDDNGEGSGHLRAIIDGIEYPINTSNFKSKDWQSRDAIFSSKNVLFMEFATGSCSLSPNREQLGMDNDTQNELIAMFNKVNQELAAQVQVAVNEALTYKQANTIAKKMIGDIGGNYVDLVKWDGKQLYPDGIPIQGAAALFKFDVEIKDGDSACFSRVKGGIKNNKFTDKISVSPKTEIFINDTNHDIKYMIGSQIRKLINGTTPLPTAYDKERFIQVVTFFNDISKNKILELFGTDNIHYLSKFLKPKKETVTKVASTKDPVERMDIFKLENGDYTRCTKAEYVSVPNDKKILVTIHSDYRREYCARNKNGNAIRTGYISNIAKEFDVEVFAVKTDVSRADVEKRFPGCVWLENFVKEKVDSVGISTEILSEIATYDYFTRQGMGRIGSGYGTENEFYFKLIPLLADQTGIVATTLSELKRLQELHQKHSGIIAINNNVFGSSIGKVDYDKHKELTNAVIRVKEEYPFLPTATNRIDNKHIAEYVNFVTESNNNKKAVVQQNP